MNKLLVGVASTLLVIYPFFVSADSGRSKRDQGSDQRVALERLYTKLQKACDKLAKHPHGKKLGLERACSFVPPPDVAIFAKPYTVAAGATTTLSWKSTNANACYAVPQGAWTGSKPLNGSESIAVFSETTFSITCGNDTATTSDSVIIDVRGKVPIPPQPPVTACSDGVDNDSDGKTDFPADKGCASATDTNETVGAQISVSATTSSQTVSNSAQRQQVGAFIASSTHAITIPAGIKFSVATSTATMGLMTDVLVVDETNTVVLGPVDALWQNGQAVLNFSQSVTFPSGKSTYKILGKISQSATPGATQTISADPLAAWLNPVDAASGDAVSFSGITPFSMSPVTLTVVVAGNVAVSSPIPAQEFKVVAGGTTGVDLGQIKLRATNESVNLNKLGLKLTNGSAGDISQVYIYNGFDLVGTAVFAGSSKSATSTFATPVSLPKDTDVFFTLKADISAVQPTGSAVSGDIVKVDVDTNGSNTSGTGAGSGAAINATGSTNLGGIRIFKSYPVLALDTLSSTGVLDGRLIRFKVTSSNFGPVSIGRLTFGLASSPVSPQNLQLFAYNDSAYSQSVSGQGSGGQIGITVAATGSEVVFAPTTNPIVVTAGSTMYFELRANTTGVSSITTTLRGDTVGSSSALVPAASVVGNFVWSPNTVGTAALTDADFVTGANIPGLPEAGRQQTRQI